MKVETLIIGSGVAAAALSNRLLAKNSEASILMLEAGERVKMQDAAFWENYVISGVLPYAKYNDEPYPDRDIRGENQSTGATTMPLNGARAFTYGGSTIQWGGWAFRLKPEDFKLNSNTGHSIDWPFGYEELEPYYGQAEHYVGVSGDSKDPTVPRSTDYPFPEFPYTLEDQPIAEAMTALKIEYSHLPIARRGVSDTPSPHAACHTTGTCKYCPFGARYSANNYLDEMFTWGNFPNLQIRLNSVAEKIIMDSRGHASGVVFLDKQTRELITVEAERVIVAAGTIESAKLLQRSKSQFWANGVGNDNDLVGRNLVTHPYYIFTGQAPDNPLRLQPEMNFPTLCTRHFDSPEEQAKGKFILVNPPSTPNVNLLSKMQAGVSRADIDSYVTGPVQIQLHGMVEIFSEAKNYVRNFDRISHMGMLETVVDFTQADGFAQRMLDIQGHVEKLFSTMNATLVGKPSISWRADHAGCTCRMSDDESQGVINRQMLVHGTENLYVCSNAAFPSIGTVNPTLTLVALAFRLGDYLNN
ncbi:MAG TPA: GMC family oxidoreductase [Pyrinomonadaceae bacterium]|jgi:choline dehydrogenase-like flavoprotein|nr:GMC family oxidoreductase [Pyrinomonadaceae bacterium]